MSKQPAVGTPAPDFTLPGLVLGQGDAEAERADYALAGQRGNPLLLVFYPGDDTAVCTKQLCSYTSDLDRFTGLGATVWGISPQDLDSHESFARKHRLGFPLLADTDRTVAKAYGIAVPGLGLRRSVFLLDGEGNVRWKHVALAGLTFVTTDVLAEQLAAVQAG
ncbi:peroxiredoxin [Streptomyces sp. SID13666]|uniref:peroxiredoxin n=1 Tax=unclassified Streptomyces TaxID=2593676 RepID=UPI0013C1055F|nr:MULTISPECIES: peroxiredoxin [unclassified Streptomyces]NEA58706.1 peroxiredoxin [Streptomyces sp. SID13666]NEA70153.1 peroxiredoxin [Streptomyces sp. SID13588]